MEVKQLGSLDSNMRLKIAYQTATFVLIPNRTPAPKHAKTRPTTNHKMRDIYTKSIRIDKAVAAIQRGDFIHFSNAANYYKYSRIAVSRRIRGLTKSKK
jgi:hypothetical protein